jgi:hypothetical protein
VTEFEVVSVSCTDLRSLAVLVPVTVAVAVAAVGSHYFPCVIWRSLIFVLADGEFVVATVVGIRRVVVLGIVEPGIAVVDNMGTSGLELDLELDLELEMCHNKQFAVEHFVARFVPRIHCNLADISSVSKESVHFEEHCKSPVCNHIVGHESSDDYGVEIEIEIEIEIETEDAADTDIVETGFARGTAIDHR